MRRTAQQAAQTGGAEGPNRDHWLGPPTLRVGQYAARPTTTSEHRWAWHVVPGFDKWPQAGRDSVELFRTECGGQVQSLGTSLPRLLACAVVDHAGLFKLRWRPTDVMDFYQDLILPYLINLSMRQKNLAAYRGRVVPAAEGRVLEIGIGSGLNLPFYSGEVRQVIGLDPSPKLLAMARQVERPSSGRVELIEGSAEEIPLEDASIDTVVTTWTLCSIPDASRALREMRRVLKPTGHLLFVEHGRAPDPNVVWWQDRLTPVWKHIGGGCHLNRAIGSLIEGAGFQFDRFETGYMRGPKPVTFMYEGNARPR